MGTAEADIRERFMTLSSYEIENPDFAIALADAISGDIEITPAQKRQVTAYVRSTLAFLFSVETAFDNGLITQDSFDAYLNVAGRLATGEPELIPYYVRALGIRENVTENVMTNHIFQLIEGM